MSFGEAVRSVYGNYAKFDGRALRSEYWWFTLFYVLVTFVGYLAIIYLAFSARNSTLLSVGGLAIFVFGLGSFIPGLAVAVRRLHDSDHSGWWLLLAFVPYLGAFILLVFMVLPSSPGYNRFGPGYGQPSSVQNARYWGATRSEALRMFAEDAQKAAASGYEPVWQDWKQQGGMEILDVGYGYSQRQTLPPWQAGPDNR